MDWVFIIYCRMIKALSFALAVPALILGLHGYEARNAAYSAGFEADPAAVILNHVLMSVCSVFYTWLMIFGLIGFFRRVFPGENRRIRYVSDSSYWLYVAHLPLIIFLQTVVSDWNLPGPVKLLLICAVTSAVLLVIYEYAVRYTFIGTMLNGKKVRVPLPPETRTD